MSQPDFESMYASVEGDLTAVPWARLEPSARLVRWLQSGEAPPAGRALVAGCGLGDDAEELARRGFSVVGFDLAPSAIRLARERFPASLVEYQVADLFAMPAAWEAAFVLVVEIRNLQSVPRVQREQATAALAGCVASGGVLYAGGAFVEHPGPDAGRPWPLTAGELAGFERAGLTRVAFSVKPTPGHGPEVLSFSARYTRPAER